MVWGPAVWDSRDYTQVTIPFIRGSLESQTTKLQLVWDIGGVHSWKLDGKHQWCSMLDGKHIYAQSEVIKKEKTLHGVNVIGVSGMLIATKATTRTTRRKHYEEEDHRHHHHHHHHHQVFTDNTVKADRWWHRFFLEKMTTVGVKHDLTTLQREPPWRPWEARNNHDICWWKKSCTSWWI